MRVLRDIEYTERQGTPLALDLYLPDTPATATILLAHGGGFFKGDRWAPNVGPLAERFTSQRLALASVSYRLATPPEAFSPEILAKIRQNRAKSLLHGVKIAKRMLGPAFEAARQDIGAACAFLRENHPAFAIQSDKIAILGISAGGIAALSLAYPDPDLPESPKPDAVIALGAAMVQPWNLRASGPPALMLHSHTDRIISPENALLAGAAARQANAPLQMLICARKGHNAPVIALMKDDASNGTPYWDIMLDLLRNTGFFSPTRAGV